MNAYFLRPHSPLVFRSGRPFGGQGDGGGGATYPFPLPSSVAGALRGAWVDASGHSAQRQDQALLDLSFAGGLRAVREDTADETPAALQVYAPQPADAVYDRLLGDGSLALRVLEPAPPPPGSGCNLPHGLWPVSGGLRAKPAAGPADWRLDAISAWLDLGLGALDAWQGRGPLPVALRTHVAIDPGSLAHLEGALFQSGGIDFDAGPGEEGILAWFGSRTGACNTAVIAGRHLRLGADGRTAAALPLREGPFCAPPPCPTRLAQALDALREGQCFRLLLLTPACFLRNGWYPDGLQPAAGPSSALEGCLVSLLPAAGPERRRGPAPADDPRRWRLRLRAAAVPPWQPLAASKLRQQDGRAGFVRRPLRRLVPAGAVYWLEIVRRGEVPLSSAWMQSACRAEYARDGFGLALPGLCAQP